MRIFWIIIAAFALVTGAIVLWNRRGGGAAPVAMAPPPPARSAPTPAPVPKAPPEADPVTAPEPKVVVEPEPDPTTERTIEAPTEVATIVSPTAPIDPSIPPSIPAQMSDAAALVADLIASAEAREAAPDEPVAPSTAEPETESIDATAGDAARITRLDDGSMLIDDRYEVSGAGTRDDPYRINWDLLISVSATYQPREGKKVIPGRIDMFDDAWVKITGYIAFPLAAREAEEALLMLNQWDGCCIGVPPSPYDGIEVMLREPIAFERRHRAIYGTIEGVLKVDPYLVNNWLVGLYLMEDASIEMGF